MTNTEFVNKLIEIAKSDTTYAKGGYGQKATEYWKRYFLANYRDNRESAVISNGLKNATANTSIYDCNCLVKSTINGNKGYTTNPCPDIDIKSMLGLCNDVSTDMAKIEIGEYLTYGDFSHCGIYIGMVNGKRCAVECTQRWDNGVQIIDIDREERKTMWKYHGKLSSFITYPKSNVHTNELKAYVNTLLLCKKGMKGEYVKKIQARLNDFGYGLDVDGDFGKKTEAAVMEVQRINGLSADGIVGIDTINTLL